MIATLTLMLALGSTAQTSGAPSIAGVVVDMTGAAIGAAHVSSGPHATTTDARGRFALPFDGPQPTLVVTAGGFAAETIAVPGPARDLRIVLRPAAIAETVTVTARSSSRLSDIAVASTTLGAATLLTSGTATLDDALRTVPGFSLFRRSSSRVANPTTQGAGVRGLAASGASRVLVLADGVPINDPFGSWVHWGSVPLMAIDRVEVVRGGVAGELYGSEAVAGVVQIITVEPAAGTVRALAEGGSGGYVRGSAYGGAARERWSGFASAERLMFDGYTLVAAEERGPADTRAGVKYWSGVGDIARRGDRLTISGRIGWFDEDRANGTALQTNDTNARHASLRATAATPAGVLALTAYASGVGYHQAFSAVGPDRAAETLTAQQRVRSSQAGAGAFWSQAWSRTRVLAGLELRHVDGTSEQTSFPQGIAVPQPAAGGAQQHRAAFAQVTIEPRTALALTLGARGGLWRTQTESSDRATTRGFVSPRASLTWRASERASLYATATWTDRTPSLNELHRDFRVGSILTLANSDLEPEDARTVEAGGLLRAGTLSVRLLGFWTRLDDAVSNVTISDAGAPLIVRQRRNAGTIRARGVESEVEWRPSRAWSVAASLALLDSIFTRTGEPGLAGRRVPQVPRWQTALSTIYARGAATVSAEWRSTGAQFDDDRNQFLLDGGGVLSLYAAGHAGRVHPFVAVENVFDGEIDVGRTPVRTVGLPRTIRAGLRVTLP